MVQVMTAGRTMRRRPVRRALAALGLSALSWAAFTAGAAADTLRAHYAVSLVGLRIGDLYANGTFAPKTYHIDLTAQLTGVAALMSNTRLALTSSGSVRKERIAPMAYATSTSNQSETRTLRMALKSGNVKAVEITPPPHFWGERVPVTEANKRNILDPTSALIMPVPAKEPLDGPAACNRTLPIYDGYARFDVALHYAGTREIEVAGYRGPVAVCTARYHPISGHMVNSRSTAFMAQNTGIEVWLGPIEPAHFVVPMHVSLPTMTGQLEIDPVEFSVVSDAAPSTH